MPSAKYKQMDNTTTIWITLLLYGYKITITQPNYTILIIYFKPYFTSDHPYHQ